MRPAGVDGLQRAELAVLAREYLLAGQLMDRAAMPHVIGAFGRDEMGDIAIDEWMGASPIYTRRMQRLLGYSGDTIDTMFKGLQLDIGAPPEFMDFRLKVIDEDHGEFWLDHCGALMDVEPMGDDYVRTMCHTIEDPTFDATAMATSPYARIRPIHRPPRSPADRHPHCHWTATIDRTRVPLSEPEPATHLATTRAATLPVATIDAGDEPGWSDYTAAMDPDLRMEQFSAPALRELLREVALQSHLLVMSLHHAIERRHDRATADSIVARQFAGSAGVTSQRLRSAFGFDDSAAAVAQVLELHPAFQPRDYVDIAVSVEGDGSVDGDRVRIGVSACPALEEGDRVNWLALLASNPDRATLGLDAMVWGVDPHLDVERVDPAGSEVMAWRTVRHDEPAAEPRDVALTRFSTGAAFGFTETPVELS